MFHFQQPLQIKPGEYFGKVKMDQVALMAKTKAPKYKAYPEFEKLMKFVIARMEASQNRMTLRPDGNALLLFDDGYAADSWAFKGQWSIDQATKTLKILDHNAVRIFQILPDGGLDGRVAFFGKEARVTFRLK